MPRMSRAALRPLLLLLALVAGQWLAVAHAHEHPAVAVDPICELCVHAAGLGTAVPVCAPAGFEWSAGSPRPPPSVLLTATGHVPVVVRNRGPPVI